MKGLERLAVAAVLFVAGIAALIYFGFPTYTHRFRLTFQIEANGQIKEGSGVISVADTDNAWLPLAQNRWHRTQQGRSPWIDLGERGIILAAIEPYIPSSYEPKPFDAGNLSFVAFLGASRGSPMINTKNVEAIRRQIGRRALQNDQLPEFIWLSNPKDPSSAKIVPPSLFSAMIGPDIRLKSVYVEITDDYPDNSLYEKLPWLADLEKQERTSRVYSDPAQFKLLPHNLLGDLW